MWNADFTWLVQPGRDVPIMSGGLLALSKKWWEERYGEMMVSTCFNLQSGNVWQSYMPSSINQVQYGFLQIKHNFFTIHTFTGGRSHGLRAPPYSARCLPRSPRRPPANSRVCPGCSKSCAAFRTFAPHLGRNTCCHCAPFPGSSIRVGSRRRHLGYYSLRTPG